MADMMSPQEVINKTRPRNLQGELLQMAMEIYTDGSCLENNVSKIRHVKASFAFTASPAISTSRTPRPPPCASMSARVGCVSSRHAAVLLLVLGKASTTAAETASPSAAPTVASTPIVQLDATDASGYVGNDAINLATGSW